MRKRIASVRPTKRALPVWFVDPESGNVLEFDLHTATYESAK